MHINQKGIDLLKHFEGRRLQAYIDPVGILTIGYGHTGSDVTPGLTITEEQADELLRADLQKFATGVRNRIEVEVNSNAFSALVCFAYNVGLGSFGNSTLRKKLNSGDTNGASREFLKWVKGTVNGKKVTLSGLVRRRKEERKLFDTPETGAAAMVPVETDGQPAQEAFFYIVRPGDTFTGIAARNGLSIEALLNWNPHIADHNLLFPGDLIRFQEAAPITDEIGPQDTVAADPAMAATASEAPWYAIARGEIGIAEVKGTMRNNARILEYHRSTSLDRKFASTDETPWCSSFVNWCISGSGLKGTNSARARSWLKWGEALETPREGCIVIFARPRAGPQAGHVALFIKETPERIHVLGGNQSNQVKESYYGKDDWLGYRWPKGKPKPASAGTSSAGPGETSSDDGEEQIFYLVQPGDTLQAIADRAGVSLEKIVAWNPQIANPNRISPGDMILLVGTKAPEADEAPLPEGSAAPWFDLAERELGTREQAGSLRNNSRILEYHSSTTLPGNLARIDETAWCSSFVNWCVTRAGLKGTNSARARSWEKWGRKLNTPRPGCIVVFSRPAGGPDAGHVGFYVGETASKISVLGGNQSNSVRISEYAGNRLLAYRWPTGAPGGGTAGSSAGAGAGNGGQKIRPPFLSRLRLLRTRIGARRRPGS